jgi:predicted acylesterase/phospholipase RssA
VEALVLSGGGSFGAFEAGVLYELLLAGKHWDKVYGTSTGAFNAVLLAQAYIDGSAEVLKRTWTETIQNTSDVYSDVWLNYAIDHPPYSYRRSLVKFIVDFERICTLQEKFTLTTTDLISGDVKYFVNQITTPEWFLEATIASGSMPPLFPPVNFGGMQLVDGGVKYNLPITKAIEDSDSVLAILCRPEVLDPLSSSKVLSGLIEIAERSLDMMMNKITYGDLKTILLVNSLLKTTPNRSGFLKGKRVIDVQTVIPDSSLPGGTLDFTHSFLAKNFETGREKGRKFLQTTTIIDESKMTPEILAEVTSSQAQIFNVFPITFDGKTLTLGCDEDGPSFKTQMENVFGRKVKLVLVNPDNLEDVIHRFYS